MGLTRLSTGLLLGRVILPKLIEETLARDPQAKRPAVLAHLNSAALFAAEFLASWEAANDAANSLDPIPTLSPVMEALIKSVDGTPHEGRIPGVGEGWDWYNHGVIQRPRDGRQAASGWVSFQELSGNPGGLSIETRNFQQWALDGNFKWIRLTGEIKGSQVHPIPPHEGGVESSMGTGPVFTLPRHGVGSQFWSWQHTLPEGTQGIVTLMEVRRLGGDPMGLLVATGGDWWPVAGSQSGNLGAMVGRFVAPTLEYRWCGASSLPEAVLRDHPISLV